MSEVWKAEGANVRRFATERTVEEWKEILAPLSAQKAAERILGDIVGFKDKYLDEDSQQLANALLAFKSLV
jgi:hypothetical protein